MQRNARDWVKLVSFLAVLGVVLPTFARGETLTVFAAASLREAVQDVANAYEVQSGHDVVLVFAASSTVSRQVALGAPADVVLLADVAWSDWLIEQGVLTSATPFAANRLVLIGRDGARLGLPNQILNALEGEVLAMAQVDAVPAGRYGSAALMSIGLWDRLEARTVQAANVRAALRFVQVGEAMFAVAYASDLVAFPDLSEVYAFHPDTHDPIVYSGGSLSDPGVDFMTYLTSQAGQSILSDWGFLPVAAP